MWDRRHWKNDDDFKIIVANKDYLFISLYVYLIIKLITYNKSLCAGCGMITTVCLPLAAPGSSCPAPLGRTALSLRHLDLSDCSAVDDTRQLSRNVN
jgi:hypothetical protein